MADHSACLQEGSISVRKRSILLSEEALDDILVGVPVQVARQLQQETKTGA